MIVYVGMFYHHFTGGMSDAVRWFAGWNVRQVITAAIEDGDSVMLQTLSRPDAPLGDIVGGQTMYEFARGLTPQQNAEFKQAMRDTLSKERLRIEAALAVVKSST